MKSHDPDDLSGMSMLELFRVETENQTAILTGSLLELERNPAAPHHLEALMRAAHSLKGAARIVNQETAVGVAHAIEDCFVAAQHQKITLGQRELDLLFQGVDLLLRISRQSGQETIQSESGLEENVRTFIAELAQITAKERPESTAPLQRSELVSPPNGSIPAQPVSLALPFNPGAVGSGQANLSQALTPKTENSQRVLRLTADNLNRLLGLAGESLVESRWLHPFAGSMLRLKRMQSDLAQTLHGLRDSLGTNNLSERADGQINEALTQVRECRQFLSDRLVDLEMFDRRSSNLSHRLYLEVLQCRMRPFGDGIRRFPRMVRDLARSLKKKSGWKSSGKIPRWTATFWKNWKHLWRISCAMPLIMGLKLQRKGDAAESPRNPSLDSKHATALECW